MGGPLITPSSLTSSFATWRVWPFHPFSSPCLLLVQICLLLVQIRRWYLRNRNWWRGRARFFALLFKFSLPFYWVYSWKKVGLLTFPRFNCSSGLVLLLLSPHLMFKFFIFQKEEFTDVSVYSSFLHPRLHRMASFHFAVNRFIRILMEAESFESEVCTIEEIAHLNGLDIDVRKLIRRKCLRFH